jgi:hypothetical protein
MLALARSAMATTGDYTDKLTHARLFPKQNLMWIGEQAPSEAESEELWEALGVGSFKSFSDAAPGVETFIKAHPNSPWVPSLQANMGTYYKKSGYFTLALNDWQAAWNATRQMTDWRGKMVADYALVNWLQLLSSLGRTDTMKDLFDETANRQISGPFQGFYSQSLGAYEMMLKRPEVAYRCGTYALDAVAQVLYGTNYFKQIWEKPSPRTGFSMADLVAFSDANHLGMVAAERPNGRDLVVPSVVHWKLNHYAAIVAKKGDSYQVVDPTFLMSRWLKADAINAECSGQFLVPAKQLPEGWRILSQEEASHIFGKGWPGRKPPPPCPCPTGTCPCASGPGSGGSGGGGGGGGSGCTSGCNRTQSNTGMPTWTVMEPWCSVSITDEPLSYQPSKGPRISFKLYYWAEGNVNWYWVDPSIGDETIFGLSYNWNCSWLSYPIFPRLTLQADVIEIQ